MLVVLASGAGTWGAPVLTQDSGEKQGLPTQTYRGGQSWQSKDGTVLRLYNSKGTTTYVIKWGQKKDVKPDPIKREYLPRTGTASLRLTANNTFNRSKLVDPDAFLFAIAEEKRLAEEALALEKAKKEAEAEALRQAAAQANAPEDKAQTGGETNVANSAQPEANGPVRNNAQGTSSIPSSQASTREVFDPELLLRYFDSGRDDDANVRVGIPFVLPYQEQDPLIMDSSATYRQSNTRQESPPAGQ